MRTPVAANTALPMAGGTVPMVGSPAPNAGSFGRSIRTVSIWGSPAGGVSGYCTGESGDGNWNALCPSTEATPSTAAKSAGSTSADPRINPTSERIESTTIPLSARALATSAMASR
jgi:hypothetical protein